MGKGGGVEAIAPIITSKYLGVLCPINQYIYQGRNYHRK